jgi:predicted HicB family RNase H-like nuclease
MMEYKGYYGEAKVDEEAGILHGEVLGLRDVVTFQGRTVDEVRQAFRDSVDDYLEFCAERGEEPEKPFSGKILVRTDPEVHRALATRASLEGRSINAIINDAIDRALDRARDRATAIAAVSVPTTRTRRPSGNVGGKKAAKSGPRRDKA